MLHIHCIGLICPRHLIQAIEAPVWEDMMAYHHICVSGTTKAIQGFFASCLRWMHLAYLCWATEGRLRFAIISNIQGHSIPFTLFLMQEPRKGKCCESWKELCACIKGCFIPMAVLSTAPCFKGYVKAGEKAFALFTSLKTKYSKIKLQKRQWTWCKPLLYSVLAYQSHQHEPSGWSFPVHQLDCSTLTVHWSSTDVTPSQSNSVSPVWKTVSISFRWPGKQGKIKAAGRWKE